MDEFERTVDFICDCGRRHIVRVGREMTAQTKRDSATFSVRRWSPFGPYQPVFQQPSPSRKGLA